MLLVSAEQQTASAVLVYISLLCHHQALSSFLHSRFSSVIYFIHRMCGSQFSDWSHSPFPTLVSIYLSVSLFLLFNRFICSIFLDSTCIHLYMIFVFLILTYLTLLCMTATRSSHNSAIFTISFLFIYIPYICYNATSSLSISLMTGI